jgi:hypothetical protein
VGVAGEEEAFIKQLEVIFKIKLLFNTENVELVMILC